MVASPLRLAPSSCRSRRCRKRSASWSPSSAPRCSTGSGAAWCSRRPERPSLGPARQTLRDVDTAREAVAAVAGLADGRLDLCTLPTLAVDPVAPLVGAFRAAHPGVAITLADPDDAGSSPTSSPRARARSGSPSRCPASSRSWCTRSPNTTCWRCSHQARRTNASTTFTHLARFPLVTGMPGTSTRRQLDDTCRDRRCRPGDRGRHRATRGSRAARARGRGCHHASPPVGRHGAASRRCRGSVPTRASDVRCCCCTAAAHAPPRPTRSSQWQACATRRDPSSALGRGYFVTGRPAARHAWKPPSRSVALRKPRSSSEAAARLDAYPSSHTTMTTTSWSVASARRGRRSWGRVATRARCDRRPAPLGSPRRADATRPDA